MGQAHTGKGIALLLETEIGKDIKQIKAKTTTNSIASQKVLEKNGFEKIATEGEEFEMNGQKLQFVYYSFTIRVSS